MREIEKADLYDDFCRKLWTRIYHSMQTPFFDLAVKTGLFERLTEPMNLTELSKAMGFNQDSAEPFLEVLLSMGLLQLKDGKYVNHPKATRFLTSGGAMSHIPSYHGMMGMLYDILDNLEDILRKGPDEYNRKRADQRPIDDEAMWSRQARGMLGGGLHQAQYLLPHLKAMPEWESFDKMMDLGGGPGSYCMVFVSGHPTMQGTVFDQKAVAEEAGRIVAEFGLDDRITAKAGDYMNDPELGGGYDFIWACATLNFAKGQLVELFEKVHKALNPGGVFASYHPAVRGSGEEDWEMVAGFAPHAMIGADMRFYENEISHAMLEAGFQTVQSKDIPALHGTQRLDLARKAKN